MPTLSPQMVNILPESSPTKTIKHYFLCFILLNVHICFRSKKKIFDKFCTKIYDYIMFHLYLIN